MNPLPRDWTVNITLWVIIWAALIGWQIITARRRPDASFGSFLHMLRRWWLTRWGILVFWIWLGWHLFVRTTY